jgi:protein TonB
LNRSVNVRAEIPTDVVTADELALAAGVAVERVDELVSVGRLATIDGRFIAWPDAVRAGRLLRAEPPRTAVGAHDLFDAPDSSPRAAAVPAAVSSAAHALALLSLIVVTSAGLATSAVRGAALADQPLRLVYLTQPGPGGGGGGGGLRQIAPPPKAQRAGTRELSSPLPERRPPPAETPREEPPKATPPTEERPEVVAPIATRSGDDVDRAGVLEPSTAQADSRGPGSGGGVGDGDGTGLGEGNGSGVGPGEGGGTGGGPYRPGSGVQPPRLLREVKATYSDEARRLGVRGEVLLEIVVRRDGTVGDVRVIGGLGHGLDQRAVAAVQQWRFSPATRLGAPVDVLVEVAVEFQLR